MRDLEIATQLDVAPREVFRARKRHGLLTEDEKASILRTRRNMLIGGVATATLAGVGGATYLSTRPITYEDAVRDEQKRQRHIDQIVDGKIPDYVAGVKYATRGILEKLAKHDYTHSRDVYADTIPIEIDGKSGDWAPINPEKVGKGIKSLVIVYETVYQDLYEKYPQLNRIHPKPELYKNFEVIVRNVILRNEFTDAKHFSHGIPNYPIELFRDSSGAINHHLFNSVTDLLSNSAEYEGVLADPRTKTSSYLQEYAERLKKFSSANFYGQLSNPELTKNTDPALIQRLRQDFHSSKLFSQSFS